DLGRHFEGRERRLLVAFQRALDLLQHDPLELADRPLSRAFAHDHGGGEGALDDGLQVAAVPRTSVRVSRFARLEARGEGGAGIADRPARRAGGGAALIGQPMPTVVRGLTLASGAACSSHLSHPFCARIWLPRSSNSAPLRPWVARLPV